MKDNFKREVRSQILATCFAHLLFYLSISIQKAKKLCQTLTLSPLSNVPPQFASAINCLRYETWEHITAIGRLEAKAEYSLLGTTKPSVAESTLISDRSQAVKE